MKYRKIIAEPEPMPYYGDDVIATDHYGKLRDFESPEKMIRWIRNRDRQAFGRVGPIVTTIEWRGWGNDFVPPTTEVVTS